MASVLYTISFKRPPFPPWSPFPGHPGPPWPHWPPWPPWPTSLLRRPHYCTAMAFVLCAIGAKRESAPFHSSRDLFLLLWYYVYYYVYSSMYLIDKSRVWHGILMRCVEGDLWCYELWKYYKVPYTRHYNPLLIRNRSWILAIHKDRIFWKNLLEKTFLASKKWVKNIQTAGYNGARTVYYLARQIQQPIPNHES
jgi:hypothetical protein